jgi:hypothetical protein
MVGIRQFLAGWFTLGFSWSAAPSFPVEKDWKIILLLSFLNFMVSNGLATWVSIDDGRDQCDHWRHLPLMAGDNSHRKEGNRFPRMAWMGILLGFVGICIIFYDHLKLLFDYSFLGASCWDLWQPYPGLMARSTRKEYADDFNPYQSIGWQMLISGLH